MQTKKELWLKLKVTELSNCGEEKVVTAGYSLLNPYKPILTQLMEFELLIRATPWRQHTAHRCPVSAPNHKDSHLTPMATMASHDT